MIHPLRADAGVDRVLREIERALGAEPDFILHPRSCGVARANDENTLVGFLAPDARAVALDVKRPGDHATAEHLALHRIWRSYGAHVATVHSVAEARAALHQARKESLSMSYVIHGRSFMHRREVASYCASLLGRGAFSSADEAFLRELLTGHPRAFEIAGRGVHRIVVGTNGFGDACFVVERVDGSRRDFSYLSCLTSKLAIETPPEAA